YVYFHLHTDPFDGSNQGLGDLVFSPVVFAAGPVMLFHRALFQRWSLDVVLPTGDYRRDAPINLGNNLVSFNPYYTFTYMITDRLETSWRFHYLWNSANTDPSPAYQATSIQ